ncbi:MAG: hypothetical protein A2X86_14920 [Bdellovibrionales bacterium GWA2_49_15]|nr:MAG: hypothetical protein A2X86_14920 [Bdellovibrionales bacterium GWA2_49_15]HAZ13365.1 hypothetical protein [Bdellovibrionales bacterium]
MANTIEEILNLASSLDLQKTKKLISVYKKKHSLSNEEQIKVSQIYSMLGMLPEAIKSLGEFKNYDFYKECDVVYLVKLIKKAFLHSNAGEKYFARSIFLFIESICLERKILLQEIDPLFYYYKAWNHLEHEEYENAADSITKLLAQPGQTDALALRGFFTLGVIAAGTFQFDAFEENYLKALALSRANKNAQWEQTLLSRMAYGYFLFEILDKGQIYLDQAKIFKQKSKFEELFQFTLEAMMLFEQKRVDQARASLLSAPCEKDIYRVSEIITYYYWKEKCGLLVSTWQKLSLACHPCNSSFSFLYGKKYRPEYDLYLPPWFKKRIKDHENDCWFFDNEDLLMKRYQDISLEKIKKPWIDLYNYKIKYSNKKTSVLSPNLQRALYKIICAGEVGIYRWSLIDTLYRNDLSPMACKEERLKQIILRLRNLKMKIKLKNNVYTFDGYQDFVLIIPMHEKI